ncbi:hypothetical protein AXG93_2015s1340 [Marchantia polymorpha subsp. ruderalis]|uniref:Uncharacterized protein n=1 Tax=Marchantia polymorpha subsp. ruderalis TaxID=1480154 RepID=A0A176W4L6_MARPO|nr:hypothetical protein AXG93_2015s1340 [Marchantia polymorpha subsp. ruderalis]
MLAPSSRAEEYLYSRNNIRAIELWDIAGRHQRSVSVAEEALVMGGEKPRESGSCSTDEKWRLLLLSVGLYRVRNIVTHGSKLLDDRDKQIFEALTKIGLFDFMRTVWKWQKVEICDEFVHNWNGQDKKTVVNNTEIDVSLQSFVMVTGLLAEESAMAPEDPKHGTNGSRSEACFEVTAKRRDGSNKQLVASMDDPVLRDLLFLLSETVWMKTTELKRVPLDLMTYVTEAMAGKKFRWSKILHTKFLTELGRLHAQSQDLSDGLIRVSKTVAGPVMCFLYIHAKLKAEALADLSGTVVHYREGKVIDAKIEDGSKEEHGSRSGVADQKDQAKEEKALGPRTPTSRTKFKLYTQVTREKRKDLSDEDEESFMIDLPECSSLADSLAANVLQLECLIARKHAELAECKLRLYAEEKKQKLCSQRL